jgi:hypothetical protein
MKLRGAFGAVVVVAMAACILGVSACTSREVVTCDPAERGAGCLQGGIHGTCVTLCDGSSSYCAFPAPTDCPESGLKFGILSGDSATKCTESCAQEDDAGPPDGGPAIASSVYVSLSALNEVQIFDADDVAPRGSMSVPPEPSESYTIFAVDPYLWMASQTHVVKFDFRTNLIAAGYPRYFSAADPCEPTGSVFGPEGWTCFNASTIQRWTGEPLNKTIQRSASSPTYLVHSTKRIFSVEGGERRDEIVVYDANTLNEVPGSPLAVDKAQFVLASSEMDRVVVISWSSPVGLYLFRESTLAPLGSVTFEPPTLVWTVAFDTLRHHVVASVGAGFLTVYGGDDLSLVQPPTTVSDRPVTQMVYDAARDRLYAAAGLTTGALVVLDGETLMNVPGSPAELGGAGQSLVLH